MSKNSVTDWSPTPAANTDVAGIDIAENCPPSGINDAIRTVMAQVASFISSALFGSITATAGVAVTGGGIRSTRTNPGTSSTQLHLQNAATNINTTVTLDLNPTIELTGVRSAQVAAVNDGTNAIRLDFLTSNGGPPTRRGGFSAGGAFDCTETVRGSLVGAGVVPTYAFDGLQSSAGAILTMAHLRNNAGAAGTGVGIDLNPTTSPSGTRSAQVIALNDGSNGISIEFRTSFGATPGRVGGFTPQGSFDVIGGLSVGSGAITVTETSAGAAPTPGAGRQTLFIDTADHKLKRKDSAGAVMIIG